MQWRAQETPAVAAAATAAARADEVAAGVGGPWGLAVRRVVGADGDGDGDGALGEGGLPRDSEVAGRRPGPLVVQSGLVDGKAVGRVSELEEVLSIGPGLRAREGEEEKTGGAGGQDGRQQAGDAAAQSGKLGDGPSRRRFLLS